MDMQLNFIVDQTEKYSSWLSAGLTGTGSPGATGFQTPSSEAIGPHSTAGMSTIMGYTDMCNINCSTLDGLG